jgi:GGDEF domain-containing protein
VVWSLAERQQFYGGRLRQFAHQMESTPYPTEPDHLQDVVALQAAGLMSCVESMSHVTESLVTLMHQELGAVERRVKDSEMTDPLTGLLNRREMESQIEAAKAAGEQPILLHFHLYFPATGASNDEVLKQVAERLAGQFRHKDLVSRWTENELMVLFRGPLEVARARSELIVPWVAGRYPLATGDHVEVGVEVKLLNQPEPAVPEPESLTAVVQ